MYVRYYAGIRKARCTRPDKMRRRLFPAKALLLLVGFAVPAAQAQMLGPSLELYPAGAIVTARYSIDVGEDARIHFHAGMNATDRRDWGEHALERGAGFGGGVAGHRYLSSDRMGPWIGVRADIWDLAIDWENPGSRGETQVTVFQPSARAGWTFPALGITFDASAALGMEMNIKTTGEPVGEGAIFLVGLAFSF